MMKGFVCGKLPVLSILAFFIVAFPSCRTASHENVSEKQVDLLLSVELGGMEQWITVRGDDRNNPLLLWLHGGPGSSQMSVAHKYDSLLEKEFVVVHWDQRGAGKSNPRDFDERTMSQNRLIQDCHELTLYLKKTWYRDSIYLLGHSWGSQLGVLTARRYSEDYRAYIGLSQVVDPLEAHVLGEEWLREILRFRGKKRELKKLDRLNGPPYHDHTDFVDFIKMVDRYGGSFDVRFGQLARTALSSPYYSVCDLFRWMKGANRGSGPMWEEALFFNAFRDVPSLDLPVFVIAGENDWNTPAELAESWSRSVETPDVCEFILFRQAAHTPCFADPVRFAAVLSDIKSSVEAQP
jgi:pimeloyl-ACP methyl ester carboxylesterase